MEEDEEVRLLLPLDFLFHISLISLSEFSLCWLSISEMVTLFSLVWKDSEVNDSSRNDESTMESSR